MKFITPILALSLFVSCKNDQNIKSKENSSIDSLNINTDILEKKHQIKKKREKDFLDSLNVRTDTIKANKKMLDKELASNESFNYIGFIENFYFSDKPEVYTELYFNRTIKTSKEYDSISKLTSKVIYKDEDNSRSLISEKIAKENFDVRGLDKLSFFDSDNVLIGEVSNLKSYEFLDQNISPLFIAVYKTPLNKDQIAYCIGGKRPNFSELKIKKISDTIITSNITKYFNSNNINTSYTNSHTQYSLNNSTKLTFSNTNDYFFIHLTNKKNKLTDIYSNDDFSNIVDLQIIPILKNGMPTLLCQFIKPETDMFWSEVLVYNGEKYVSTDKQRIRTNNR